MRHSRRKFLIAASGAAMQAFGDTRDFRIYTEHPRLLLTSRRLRLLRRERERNSARWQQLDALVSGGARMPEPAFAAALHYQVSQSEDAGRQAVRHALAGSGELRQLALVFDWCQPVLSKEQCAALLEEIHTALQAPVPAADLPAIRSRALAAIAASGHAEGFPETELGKIVNNWWAAQVTRLNRAGMPRDHHYALFELLHAIRDNLNLDLSESALKFFSALPLCRLLSYYPASYPAPENEYRIPAAFPPKIDLPRSALSRAADMEMLAYEPNVQEYQYLQGWTMDERFVMKSAFGAPYEFLWANPYHPGLSYHTLPLAHHDATSGSLFVRSSWDDDATWAGYFDRSLQAFREGEPKVIPLDSSAAPLRVAQSLVVPPARCGRFEIPSGLKDVFVIGLEAGRKYAVEIDDEEMFETESDRGGIVRIDGGRAKATGVRVRPAGHAG